MYDPLFRLCLLRTQTAWHTNTCSWKCKVRRRLRWSSGWAPILALIVVVFGSYSIVPGLAVFAGPMQAAVAFLLWRYSEYLAAITSAAKRYAFQTSEVNFVEIIRSEVVSKELGMAR